MPFDPTKPVNGSPIVSAGLRNQFAGLKALIDQCATPDDISNAIQTDTANSINGFSQLNLTVSNPPTQAQVQSIVDKLNELINALRH